MFPPIYKKIWVSPLLWFLESVNFLLNKWVGGCSHYKWCANDIAIYSKKTFSSFSINKKFLFLSFATSSFRNFEIRLFTFLLIVLYPFPYSLFWRTPFCFTWQRGLDKKNKTMLNNWFLNRLIKSWNIKHWQHQLKWAQLWNTFLLCQRY